MDLEDKGDWPRPTQVSLRPDVVFECLLVPRVAPGSYLICLEAIAVTRVAREQSEVVLAVS
jgi:hypothetical protein